MRVRHFMFKLVVLWFVLVFEFDGSFGTVSNRRLCLSGTRHDGKDVRGALQVK